MNLYERIGGRRGCEALAKAFYARVEKDPTLRPFFSSSFRCAIEQISAFVAQILDGPAEDMQKRWWLSLRESHARFRLGPRERDAWMRQMTGTLAELGIEESTRRELQSLFESASSYIVGEEVPGKAGLWGAQLRVEEIVAAVRSGDSDRVLALVNHPRMRERFKRNRSVHAQVMALMIGSNETTGSGDAKLVEHVRQEVSRTPELIEARYAGRTLLHGAAAAGNVAIVELLLKLGADPNALDAMGHAPLYRVGNECAAGKGGDVVHALVRAGAKVDAAEGVQRCTALHMAARRGNVDVAKALLECGASMEARDKTGATPLRRALNCRKAAVAELLKTKWPQIRWRTPT